MRWNRMLAFEKWVSEIIKEYKKGNDEPLDGDEVDRLTEHLRNKMNLHEGNITQEEYIQLEVTRW